MPTHPGTVASASAFCPAAAPERARFLALDRHLVALLIILAAGFFLRIFPSAQFTGTGFDESMYHKYITTLRTVGYSQYDALCEAYIEAQRDAFGFLPPTRVLYISAGYGVSEALGISPLAALRGVSCAFTIFTLVVSAAFAWRAAGKTVALGVTALMACAPTQIHMSQHSLIDGFFAFWVLLILWSLWEVLQKPRAGHWLAIYTCATIALVLTKESAAFAWVGILGLLAANRWLKFGTVTPRLLIATAAGPAIAVLILCWLAGGPGNFIEIFHLYSTMGAIHPYSIKHSDGPWYRYIIDLTLLSPVIVLLSIGALFHLKLNRKVLLFAAVFVGACYLLMCNIPLGMNARYTNMWDMPLRLLAFSQLAAIAAHFGARAPLVLLLSVAGVCVQELRQYYIFFVQHPLYELVTDGLLHAVRILNP